MKRTIALVLAAAGIVACQQSSADKVQEDRKDLAEARQDAAKEVGDAHEDASRKLTDAHRDANEKVEDKRSDLVKDEQDLAAKEGRPVTVVGRVDNVKDDSFKLHTTEGRDLNLKFPQNKSGFELKEGAEVRASYVHENNDDFVQHVEVIRPVAPKMKK